jgi:hypothetical protein
MRVFCGAFTVRARVRPGWFGSGLLWAEKEQWGRATVCALKDSPNRNIWGAHSQVKCQVLQVPISNLERLL